MDTILLPHKRIEKTASNTVGVIIALSILASQQLIISAKDLDIGSYTGLSPTLNYIIENQAKKEKRFKTEISYKYPGAKIVEIEKGISHVRMIRYYNNRPVRINIIELSRVVNDTLNVIPAIASDNLASKSKISKIAEKNKAIVAINGGYFKPQTGVPLGT